MGFCRCCKKSFKKKTNAHVYCSQTCKGKYKYFAGVVTTDTQYKKISGYWNRYFSHLMCHHNRRKDGLTVDSLLKILDEQQGLCALSGVPLTCIRERGTIFKTNASIDRINAKGPYIKENIQLVCVAVNKFRIDMDINEYIDWCQKVVEYQNGKKKKTI